MVGHGAPGLRAHTETVTSPHTVVRVASPARPGQHDATTANQVAEAPPRTVIGDRSFLVPSPGRSPAGVRGPLNSVRSASPVSGRWVVGGGPYAGRHKMTYEFRLRALRHPTGGAASPAADENPIRRIRAIPLIRGGSVRARIPIKHRPNLDPCRSSASWALGPPPTRGHAHAPSACPRLLGSAWI